MGYQVKWVEDNLGVSRKALRCLEKAGLMPANENNQYRDYSDEDIDKIWFIRLLQGIGYSLKEIANMKEGNIHDINQSLAEKIVELEKKRDDIDKHLGYAKAIKVSGRIPTRPKKSGTINCNEFKERAIEGWNINEEPRIAQMQEINESILSKPSEELDVNDVRGMLEFFKNLTDEEMKVVMTEKVLLDLISNKRSLGSQHIEIQLLVKCIYENQIFNLEGFNKMTEEQFARIYSSSFVCGDIARNKETYWGKEVCEFIADAFAVFGGYTGYKEIEEKGL